MEERRFKRYNVRFHSVVLSKGNNYTGTIENVSEEGIGYIMSTVREALEDLLPGEIIKLIILTSSGDTLNLNCEIRWTNVHHANDKISMGAKIIDPPAKYKEFLDTLE